MYLYFLNECHPQGLMTKCAFYGNAHDFNQNMCIVNDMLKYEGHVSSRSGEYTVTQNVKS